MWNEMEASDEEDHNDEVAMVWFTVIEDNYNEDEGIKVREQNSSYDDLFYAFKEIMNIWKDLQKNNSLKMNAPHFPWWMKN